MYSSRDSESYSGGYSNYPSGYPNPAPGEPLARRYAPAQQPRRRIGVKESDGGLGVAFRTSIGFLAVIWIVFFIDLYVFGGGLRQFGVRPRDTQGLWGIFAAPLLHADMAHLVSNSLPGALFAGLVAWSSRRLFWQVTFLVTVVSGGLTWLIGGIDTVHIGASGLIYGWLAFLVVRGFVNRAALQILLGLLLLFSYSGLIWGVLPTQAAVSWQMHLFGAVGGIWAATMFKRGRN